jgi:uncharacterized membrane protein SpoIIM required for sporulation
MKFIVSLLLSAFLGYVAPLFFPWWSFAVTSFIIALAIHQRPWKAFVAGFSGLFLLWGIYAFMIDRANEHLLSVKIAQVLPLGGSYILLIIVTAFVGGIISGFAALTGSFLRTKSR